MTLDEKALADKVGTLETTIQALAGEKGNLQRSLQLAEEGYQKATKEVSGSLPLLRVLLTGSGSTAPRKCGSRGDSASNLALSWADFL